MLVLLLAGLVILLVVLVAARSAMGEERSASDAVTESSGHQFIADGGRATAPRPGPVRARQRGTDPDYFLWESRRIAVRGESRASALDFFGYLVGGLGGFVALGAAATALGTAEELSSGTRWLIVLSAGGTVVFLAALAAILFGFSAVVRNTSRTLMVAAGEALDSFEPAE